jgi:DNA polymerase-3 subunit delta'
MLFGHEEKIQAFARLLEEGNVSHAYLFFGDKGIGKHSFAKLLAYAFEFGAFEERTEPLIDAMFIHPDPETGSIGIDSVRAIKNFVWQTPIRSPRRLVIVDDAEALTPEAQGALLKVVEEPPPHATLVFVASEPQSFTPPLLSRLAKVYFSRLSKDELTEVLVEHFKAPREKAKRVAERSFGRIGKALAMLKGDEKKEESIYEEVEKHILEFRGKDVLRNAPIISWLLERETQLKRFNLNPSLQAKAIHEKISHHGNR